MNTELIAGIFAVAMIVAVGWWIVSHKSGDEPGAPGKTPVNENEEQ